VLLADEAGRGVVQPIYVSVGLAWEPAEREVLERFLVQTPSAVRPVVALRLDMTDVYPTGHWAIEGSPPGYHTPDEDVYLPGRNVALLAKASVYCALAGIPRLLLGTLDANPFPDATPAFRVAMAGALSLGLAHDFQIDAPYADLDKADVVRKGARLGVPLALTLSCMRPVMPDPQHCGVCSKCRERHDAFVSAGIPDPTEYEDRRYVAPRD
jgi:7-cyano-7-deazaguanine synthase